MKLHSKLSPSSASAWCECTAQPTFVTANEHRLPPDRGSSYADEGTQAHAYAEEVLLGNVGIDELPEEFRPFIRTYVDSCTQLIVPGAQVFVERSIPLYYRLEDVGTADFITISDAGMHIRDLKYGKGQPVSSEFNYQLAIYAYSTVLDLEMLYEFPPDFPITIHAIQPRHHEWVDTPWITTVGELRTFCETHITPAATAAQSGDGVVFAPSASACRWCPAAAICEARAAWLRELPSGVNPLDDCEDLDAPAPDSLSDEQLLRIFKATKLIEGFLADVGKHMLKMALMGTPIGSTKLVAGRSGNRQFVDENTANAALVKIGLTAFDDRYEQKLRSPAQVEKTLKERGLDVKALELITTRSKGQPVIALEEDKRPAISSPLDGLENLDAEDSIE